MIVRGTALVTGAASGIGAAIARRFREGGYKVAYFDVNGDAAEKTAAQAESSQGSIVIQGDASEEPAVKLAIERTEAELGSLDVLVNNVGMEINGTVIEQSGDEWDRHMDVNLRSAFLFAKYALPGMEAAGRGVILNIASVHSFVSWPRCAAYDATKAGLLGLTRALAIDHGKRNIRVNAIAPGYIATPLLEKWFASGAANEIDVLKFHPLGRIGKPEDVAEAAFFLASDAAAFITGTCLTVDGGLTAAGQ